MACWSAILWDLCTVPAKISRKNSYCPMNFIPFEVFSMGVCVNAMVLPFSNWKITVWFFIYIARQRRPFMNPDREPIFLSKVNGSPSKMCILFEGRSGVSTFLMESICWAQTVQGNWIVIERVPWKQIRCRTTEPPGFSNRPLISTIGLDTFILHQELCVKNTYSSPKSFHIMTDWSI
jgi:hypothetical protein